MGKWLLCKFLGRTINVASSSCRYSYSKTRGLFGGISIEGSVIVERHDANVQAYKSPVTVKMLLGGAVDPPPWAEFLIKTLGNCTGMPGQRDWVHDVNRPEEHSYAFARPRPQSSPSSSTQYQRSSFLRKKKSDKQVFPPAHWDEDPYFRETSAQSHDFDRISGHFESRLNGDLDRRTTISSLSYSMPSHKTGNSLVADLDDPFGNNNAVNVAPVTTKHIPRAASLGGSFKYSYSDGLSSPASISRSQSMHGSAEDNKIAFLGSSSPFFEAQKGSSYIQPKPQLLQPLKPGEGSARAIALYDFKAVEVNASLCFLF